MQDMSGGKAPWVLLIEQELSLKEVQQDALELAGYRSVTTTRSEALDLLRIMLPIGRMPMAIVMDDISLRGTETEGYLLVQLRRFFATLGVSMPPLILITVLRGHPSPDVLGVQDILCRPFPVQHLVDAISRLCYSAE